jgi:glycosyltransferase involved in cell wall biosynthesis
MVTIGYDGTAVVQQRAGIGRYARELLVAFNAVGGDDRFKIVSSSAGASEPRPALGPRFRWYDLPVSDRISNAVWQRLRMPLPVEGRLGRLDVFHSPDFSLAPSRAPSIVTVHDLTFEVLPQVAYPTLAAYLHHIVPRSIRRSRVVITPSEHTKREVMRIFDTSANKIHVIPEGVSTAFSAEPGPNDEATLMALDVHGPYLLAAGTLEPRKNYERLLRAFAQVRDRWTDIKLVVVGGHGWMFDGIFHVRDELKLVDSTRFLGHVSDDVLATLYRRAEATIYPSLYEGFGLPGLEAMACGSPLIASGNTSLPEVCDSAAIYIDPWDVDDIAATISAVLDDGALRANLRTLGPLRAAQFTWERAARTTLDLYHDVSHA